MATLQALEQAVGAIGRAPGGILVGEDAVEPNEGSAVIISPAFFGPGKSPVDFVEGDDILHGAVLSRRALEASVG